MTQSWLEIAALLVFSILALVGGVHLWWSPRRRKKLSRLAEESRVYSGLISQTSASLVPKPK